MEQSPRGQAPPPERPEAQFRPSRWPGWIWAVPVAALLIVGWLGLRELLFQGPEVTVRFEKAADVKASDTKAKYQGMAVGQVESVTFENDLGHVDVKVRFQPEMSGHLGPGTRYWITGQNISLGNLSSIKSAIAGPSIAIDPRPGDTVSKVEGLEEPPVLKDTRPGREYILQVPDLGQIARDTPVYFQGESVGRVVAYAFDAAHRQFRIRTFVRAPYDDLVRPETHFWTAGPVHLSSTPSGPSVEFQSLPTLMQGAIAFETPADSASQPSPREAVFTLYPDKDTAQNAPKAGGVAYTVVFGNQQSGLPAGAPVRLVDTPIGSVSQSTLEYDAATGTLNTRATIVIDPARLHIRNAPPATTPRSASDEMMRKLIAQGLRAELAKATPVVGSEIVRLRFVARAPPATLGEGDPPSIPTDAGADVDAILAKANDIMNKANGIPLDQIGNEIQAAAQKLTQLSQSPETARSLQDLQQALQNVRAITADTRQNLQPILTEMRQAAAQAQDAVRSARAVLSTQSGAGANPAQSAALPGTLYELTRAAKSLRELADYLDRHPEALLAGKGRAE